MIPTDVRKQKNGFIRRAAAGLAVFAVWLGIWWAASALIGKEILVPSPVVVLRRLAALAQTSVFWKDTGASLLRVLCGFALAVASGVILSVAMHLSPVVRAFFSPALSVIRSTPVPSFIILALVWIKSNNMPVFIAFLMVLPVVCANMTEGIENVDPRLLQMTRVYGIRGTKLVRSVYAPSVAPYLLAACRTGLGLAWKAGVAAEVIGRTAGSIGLNLYESKLYLETPDLFAWTLTVILLSLFIERLLMAAIDAVAKRRNTTEVNGSGN